MIVLSFEKVYADMIVGSIFLEREKRIKLAQVCIDRRRPFRYLGKPMALDGVYPLKYANFNMDGYHFRPMVNRHTVEIRYMKRDEPTWSMKAVVFVLEKKAKWEKICKKLYMAGEKEITIENYDNRDQLPKVDEKFLNIEEEEEEEWEE